MENVGPTILVASRRSTWKRNVEGDASKKKGAVSQPGSCGRECEGAVPGKGETPTWSEGFR